MHAVQLLSRPLSANPLKWSNTLKQFVNKLPTNCLSVFDHFVILALKELGLNEPAALAGLQKKPITVQSRKQELCNV